MKTEKSMVPVVNNYFDYYLEDISIGIVFNGSTVVPVIKEKDMLVEGTIFMPNRDVPEHAVPSVIICSIKSLGDCSSRDERICWFYECQYYSRSRNALLKQTFAVLQESKLSF